MGGSSSSQYDAEIGYLESTGGCIIDTGYIPTGDDIRIQTKVLYNGYVSGGQWIAWYSAYSGETYNTYRIIRSRNTNNAVLFNNGSRAGNGNTTITNITIGDVYTIDLNRLQYDINGITGTLMNVVGTENTGSMTVFSELFKGRFYYFRISKNDVLKLDLIPVRVGQTGYMYDRVSGTLFGNSGTGDFILGPDKT